MSNNEETLELLEPYFNLRSKCGKHVLLTPEHAKMASMALAGITGWMQGIVECVEINESSRAKSCLPEGNKVAHVPLQQSQVNQVDNEIAAKEAEIRRLTAEVAALK